MRSGNGLALILIGFGGIIILGKLGIGLGFFMGLIIPILVILLGVMAWRNGSKTLGGIIGIIGGIMLLGQLSHLFIWAAAIALIVFGVSMLRRNSRG
jgi:hypothetical protein